MFGSLKREVQEYFFGYRVVKSPNFNSLVVELPNLSLIRYLTSGNKKVASEFVAGIYRERDKIADEIFIETEKNQICDGLQATTRAAVLHNLLSSINAKGKAALNESGGQLKFAIELGWNLGCEDETNIGRQPPVARGIHIDCINKLNDHFPEDIQFATAYCIERTFFLTRAGLHDTNNKMFLTNLKTDS